MYVFKCTPWNIIRIILPDYVSLKKTLNFLCWTSVIPTTIISVALFLLKFEDVFAIQIDLKQQLKCPAKI
jgi:hypothetical protein